VEDPEYEYRKSRFAAYQKERDSLRAEALQISGRYDQAVLALAGGSLALSITFLEKIAPNPARWTTWILGIAWLLLIASLLCELFAITYSQAVINLKEVKSSNEYRDYLESLGPEMIKLVEEPTVSEADILKKTDALRLFNAFARWTLVVGVALLCAFSLCNLPEGKTTTDEDSTTDDMKHPRNSDNSGRVRTSNGSFVAPSGALPPPPPPRPPANPNPTPVTPQTEPTR
jgi:hypothetical protein